MKRRAIWGIAAVLVLFFAVLVWVFLRTEPNTETEPAPQGAVPSTPPIVEQQAPVPDTSEPAKSVLGYYTQYAAEDKNSYRSLATHSDYLDQVTMMTFHVTATGDIAGTPATEGIDLAASKRVPLYASLTNESDAGFDKKLAHTVLSNPDLRQKTVSRALDLVKQNRFGGLNLDFENMYPTDRAAYTSFVQELAEAMHNHSYRLIVSAAAKQADAPQSNWFGAFDYAALGQAADQVQLMTYDENGPWGDPGSVAGYPWVESVISYAVSVIPSHKILIGLPSYGYDWNMTAGTGKAVTWKGIPNLLAKTGAKPQWDVGKRSPYFSYTAEDGSAHIVWYEDERSITAKVQLVHGYELGGVSVWRMGLEDESFWQAVQSGLAE
ncbi:glycosyl hydrolase family 18 protein [Tumebacillus algifaecis]|nr:glycosyl hydrolase family 18 protein [Tumebacillus algifaecis]